ncbi:MAG: CapA family protein [Lachnospiraceae bacterium]|jgi:poly-gamma-glutamate capsule biosynthesis protein CapA/YwtB (metallophosphatase superfamily)
MEPENSRLSRRARIERGKGRRAELRCRNVTVDEALSKYGAETRKDGENPPSRAERIARGEKRRAELASRRNRLTQEEPEREKTAAGTPAGNRRSQAGGRPAGEAASGRNPGSRKSAGQTPEGRIPAEEISASVVRVRGKRQETSGVQASDGKKSRRPLPEDRERELPEEKNGEDRYSEYWRARQEGRRRDTGRKVLYAVCAIAAAFAITIASYAGFISLLSGSPGGVSSQVGLSENETVARQDEEEAAGSAGNTGASAAAENPGTVSPEGTSEAAVSEAEETQNAAAEQTETASVEQTESQTPAVVNVAPAMQPVTVNLVAVGDNLMHRSVSMSGLQADGSYNYDYNFRYTKEYIESADLACINQETVIGGNELGIQGYPNFNGRTEMADELASVGFDVVLGANNHILDQNAQGVLHMITYFNTNYPEISVIGIHGSWETRDQLTIRDVNGIRIALINYTDLLNIPQYYTGSEYLVDYLDYDRLAALIAQAKAQSDFVVVFPHWGTEYNLSTDEKQAQEAAFLAQQGVDLVIGTHPHVVEPVDYIDRPDGGKMLIYYSLGNYQSIQNIEKCIIGGMARVEITKDGIGTRITGFDMEFLATDYRMSMTRELDYYDLVTTYPWEMYSMDLSQTSWAHYDNPDFNDTLLFQLEEQMNAQVQAERAEAGFTDTQ